MEKKKTHSESLTHFSYNQKSLRIRRKKSGLLYSRWYRNPISKNCSPNNNTGREDFLITKMTTIIILLGLGCPIQSLVLTLMKLQAHLGSSHIIRSIPQHMWRRSSLGRRRLGTAAGDPPTDWLVGKKKNDLRFSQICLLGEHEPRTNFNSVYFFYLNLLLEFFIVFCLPLFAQPLWSFWFFSAILRWLTKDSGWSSSILRSPKNWQNPMGFCMVFHGFPPKLLRMRISL